MRIITPWKSLCVVVISLGMYFLSGCEGTNSPKINPQIISLTPTSGPIGATITVTGTGFGTLQEPSAVTFEGTSASITSWSDTSIYLSVPPWVSVGANSVIVTVGGNASNSVKFTVLAPTITNINPSGGDIITPTTVTIEGSNFGSTQGTSSVTFGGISLSPSTWSDISITATVSPCGLPPGANPVQVITYGHGSNAVNYTVLAPVPTIAGISPTSGIVAKSNTVTISGSGFGFSHGTSFVKFGTFTLTPTVLSGTSISVTVPSCELPVGANAVRVITCGQGSTTVTYTALAPAPTISGIAPSSGGYGNTLTISGNEFGSQTGASGVWFTTSPMEGFGASVTSWSDTTIQACVPCGLPIATPWVEVQTQMCGVTYTVLSSQQFANTVTGTCGLGTWRAASSLGTARTWVASVVWNGWVYALGGADSNLTALNSVERAPINADGSLGAWQATSSMGTVRGLLASVVWNGWVYALGGADSNFTALNSVERAPINPDGSIGSWQATSSMGTARFGLASVVWNGWVYALGGFNCTSGCNSLNSVERAPINADGSLGAWQATSSMGTPRDELAAVVWNGWVYALGGEDSNFTALNSVERAPINADGSLGAWQVASSLGTARYLLASVVWNGWAYALGGTNGSSSFNSVERVPINANGTLGAWQAASSMPMALSGLAAVVWNGRVYILGGYSSGTSNIIELAPIQ